MITGCGGATDHSKRIANSIGAQSCTKTSYGITSKLDNSKTPIYDCQTGTGEKCVTEEGGIVNDRTALVKILFASALSGGKPGCVS